MSNEGSRAFEMSCEAGVMLHPSIASRQSHNEHMTAIGLMALNKALTRVQ